jgi:hypothetical protein
VSVGSGRAGLDYLAAIGSIGMAIASRRIVGLLLE